MKYFVGFGWGIWLAFTIVGAWNHFANAQQNAWFPGLIFGGIALVAATVVDLHD